MTHQLDRIEEMLTRLTANLPDNGTHMLKRDVSITVTDMLGHMLNGRKIEAIKAHRMLTGFGLKESKDEIERVMSRMVREVV